MNDTKKVYIGNLPWGTKEEALRAKVESFGPIVEPEQKPEDSQEGKRKETGWFFKVDERGNARFAIVTMSSADADKVIEALNDTEFDADDGRGPRNLIVNEARPFEPRPRTDRRTGGYNNNRSGGQRYGNRPPRRDYNSFGSDDYSQAA